MPPPAAPAPGVRRPWRLHLTLLAVAAAAAGAVALLDLAGAGRGAFLDMSGVLSGLAAATWIAYAAVSTALVVRWGTPERLRVLHGVGALAGPVLVLAAFAVWAWVSGW